MEEELLTQSQQIAVLQAENNQNLHERGDLHMDLETTKQKLKEMQGARDCWRETSYVFSDKYKEAVGFVNTMLPDFVDILKRRKGTHLPSILPEK